MGFAQMHKERQEALKRQQRLMHPECRACGNRRDVEMYANDHGKWVQDCEAYKDHFRCFLCSRCLGLVRPETMSLIETGSKEELRQFPIQNISGKYLPGVTQRMLECVPHHYPAYDLGEKNIRASIEQMIRLVDCTLLELIPNPGQDYMIDAHLHKLGCIITSFKEGYQFPQLVIPCRVKFTAFFDEHDRPRVAIWRK